MLAIQLRTDFGDVQKLLDSLPTEVGVQAMSSAMNRVVDQARTQMVRSITAEYNVSAAYVRERLQVKRATAKGVRLEASLSSSTRGNKRSANIIAFVEKSTSLAQARKRAKNGTLQQLYVKVKRGGPAKPLQGAFIGNQGRTVFERTGTTRLPIKPVQVIDVPQMFTTRRVHAEVTQLIEQRFPELFARDAAFFLSRWKR